MIALLEKKLHGRLQILEETIFSSVEDCYSVEASKQLSEYLSTYLTTLLKYREKVNIIGTAVVEEIIDKHIIDCLLGLPYFLKWIQKKQPLGKQKIMLADMGSGAGFPGLILSIAFQVLEISKVEIHLIESKSRKTQFLQSIVAELHLSNVKIQQKNILELKEKYAVLTSRAFASLKKTRILSQHLTDACSMYFLFKGRKEAIEDEVKATEIRQHQIIPLRHPYFVGERHLLQVCF